MATFLGHLLETQPKAFYPAAASPQAQAAPGALGSGLVRTGERLESGPEAVLRRLALDDSACCMMSTIDGQHGVSTVCSRRMEELFLSTDEFKSAMAKAAVLPMLLWPL